MSRSVVEVVCLGLIFPIVDLGAMVMVLASEGCGGLNELLRIVIGTE